MRRRAERTVLAGFLSVCLLFSSVPPSLALRAQNSDSAETLRQLEAGLEEAGPSDAERQAARAVEYWRGEVRQIVESDTPGLDRALANLWVRLHWETTGAPLHERLDQAVVDAIPAALFPDVAVRLRVIRRVLLPDFIAHGLRLPQTWIRVDPPLEILIARQIAGLQRAELRQALEGKTPLTAELPPEWTDEVSRNFGHDLTLGRFLSRLMTDAGYSTEEFSLRFERIPGFSPARDPSWSGALRYAADRVFLTFTPRPIGQPPASAPAEARPTGGETEAGLEENGSQVQEVYAPYPSAKDRTELSAGHPVPVYASILLDGVLPALRAPEAADALSDWPQRYVQRLNGRLRRITDDLQSSLMARLAGEIGGEGVARFPVENLQVTDLVTAASVRFGGSVPEGLPAGDHDLRLEVSADGGRSWKAAQERIRFSLREPGPVPPPEKVPGRREEGPSSAALLGGIPWLKRIHPWLGDRDAGHGRFRTEDGFFEFIPHGDGLLIASRNLQTGELLTFEDRFDGARGRRAWTVSHQRQPLIAWNDRAETPNRMLRRALRRVHYDPADRVLTLVLDPRALAAGPDNPMEFLFLAQPEGSAPQWVTLRLQNAVRAPSITGIWEPYARHSPTGDPNDPLGGKSGWRFYASARLVHSAVWETPEAEQVIEEAGYYPNYLQDPDFSGDLRAELQYLVSQSIQGRAIVDLPNSAAVVVPLELLNFYGRDGAGGYSFRFGGELPAERLNGAPFRVRIGFSADAGRTWRWEDIPGFLQTPPPGESSEQASQRPAAPGPSTGLGAGLEETTLPGPVFPEPVETDREPAHEVWEDGGAVYPSGRDRLGTVAFVSPSSDGKGGVGIYASLWKLDHPAMIPELWNLPEIPRFGTAYLYGEDGKVSPGTRRRVTEILRKHRLEVVARISTDGRRWEIPMIPIDVGGTGGGVIRFQGWVPATPEFVGDHKVTIEVRWRFQWHRLSEKGWFRIHPLNGSELRVPAAEKYKLWKAPTGQPVVIGWVPHRKLDLATDPRVPRADQPYWIRFRDGRSYLLTDEQMDRFGFRHDPRRSDLQKGEPIVQAAIDVDAAGGVVEIPSAQLFEDQDGTLGARLRRSFEVLGIRWRLAEPTLVSVAEAEILGEVLLDRLNSLGSAGQLRDLFAEIEDGNGGWGYLATALSQLHPAKRDRLLRLMRDAFDEWAERNGPADAPAPLSRVSREPGPRVLQVEGPLLGVFSLNGVRDLTLRKRKDLPGQPVEGITIGGGGPLAVARASVNLRPGARAVVVALGLGESGERLFEGLEDEGLTQTGADGEVQPVPTAEQETRVSVNGSVSSSPRVPSRLVRQAVDFMIEKISASGPGGTLVMGEHLIRVSDQRDPRWVTGQLAALAGAARELGWETAVAASNSWNRKTYQTILETRPGTFHLDLEPFTRLVDSTEEDLLYRPREEVAELADQIRRRYGVERFIVSLKAAGEILVTPSGWYAAVPSPALELTYVTGERDVVLGVFLRLLQWGFSPKDALEQAVTAGVLHMEGWGRPVTEEQIRENRHRANAWELLRPPPVSPPETAAVTPSVPPRPAEGSVSTLITPSAQTGWSQVREGLRRFSALPDPGSPQPATVIREILARLPRGSRSAVYVLIGPAALAGSEGVPALWPLLIELKAVLPESEWRDVRDRLLLYTEDQQLSNVLREADYGVSTTPAALNGLLSAMARASRRVIFYMGRGDGRLRGSVRGITQGIQLTRENYLSVLGHLLQRVGFQRPEPQQLEGLPEALMEAA